MANKVTTYNHGVSWEEAFGVSQRYSVNCSELKQEHSKLQTERGSKPHQLRMKPH